MNKTFVEVLFLLPIEVPRGTGDRKNFSRDAYGISWEEEIVCPEGFFGGYEVRYFFSVGNHVSCAGDGETGRIYKVRTVDKNLNSCRQPEEGWQTVTEGEVAPL